MSRILIPIDYSVASHNAYCYGLHLAEELQLDVVLAHYYSGSIDPRVNLYIGGDGTIMGSHVQHMRQFAYSTGEGVYYPLCEPPTGVEVTYEAEVSMLPSAAILRRAREKDISLVVMATRSSKSVLKQWLGSVSTTVSEASGVPVFLIPPHARYRPLNHLIVAYNPSVADPRSVQQLRDFAGKFRAGLDFVHVDRSTEGDKFRDNYLDLLARFSETQDGEATRQLALVTLTDTDISRGVLDYAADSEADLLAIITQKRSWWKAALQATLTQDLALRSTLPVLVLHAANPAEDRGETNSEPATFLQV